VKSFTCDVCGRDVYFENTVCVSCGSALGYSRAEGRIVVRADDVEPCVNLRLNGCNWVPDVAGGECFACSLTRTRPSDADSVALPQYYKAEQAKRRLVFELDVLGLPVTPYDEEAGTGVTFDLLSSVRENVVIGHAGGVVTIDLAESDDAHRERVRVELGEAYRTMLGHFRHEIGHYYESVLVDDTNLTETRELFGDDSKDYQAEIDRHYAEGPPVGWQDRYVSEYATMHPFEDFAETFAHVLHIHDTLETASSFGLILDPKVAARSFSDVIAGTWLPLSYGLNQINRSMGHDDLYPFFLPAKVIEKMEFVSHLIGSSAPAPVPASRPE
jgi:hypothetical protein